MPNWINSITLFCVGWFLTMMSLLVGFGRPLPTFIHMWQVELSAAVFLAAGCGYILIRTPKCFRAFSRDEFCFLILPITLFICWSALSSFWANSWKSTIHHTLVWLLFLIFFLIVRSILETRNGFLYLGITLLCALLIFSIGAVAGYVSFVIFGGENSLGIRHAKYGEQINTILPLLIVTVVRLRDRQFLIGVLSIATLWLLIYCSLGRINLMLFAAGFLATAATIVLVPRFRRYRMKLAVIAMAVVIAPIPLQLFAQYSETSIPLVAQRLGDKESLSSSNNFRKLMIGVSLEMIQSHPLRGLGADNFGFEVNEYRRRYVQQQPDDPALAEAEDTIPERSHNEFLQIFAELGIVGVGVAMWLVAGLGLIAVRSARRLGHRSLFGPAAVIGIMLFCASSLVSSFSFRLIQNGFVFFFVLAIAAKTLMRGEPKEAVTKTALSKTAIRAAAAAGLAGCLLLAGYWSVRLRSSYLTAEANNTQDLAQATKLYTLAANLDDENPDARNNHGMRLFQEKRYEEAVPPLSEAIRIGRARSVDFSLLASAQSISGDDLSAEKTMEEARKLYPRSVFVLARCAHLLHSNGKVGEAEKMLELAKGINPREANTWWTFLNEGSNAAAAKALKNDVDFKPLMDLRPLNAVYAVRAEREIRFPDEAKSFDFTKAK
jgi:O-antigen ligase/Tfp pilus assembly protein PilF